ADEDDRDARDEDARQLLGVDEEQTDERDPEDGGSRDRRDGDQRARAEEREPHQPDNGCVREQSPAAAQPNRLVQAQHARSYRSTCSCAMRRQEKSSATSSALSSAAARSSSIERAARASADVAACAFGSVTMTWRNRCTSGMEHVPIALDRTAG